MTYTRPRSAHRYIAALASPFPDCCLSPRQARAQGPTIDFQAPEGSVMSGTWVGGTESVPGRRQQPARRSLDHRRGRRSTDKVEIFPCYYGCSRHAEVRTYVGVALATASFADGVHTATVQAVDGDGAVSSLSVPVRFDNTPPAPPQQPCRRRGRWLALAAGMANQLDESRRSSSRRSAGCATGYAPPTPTAATRSSQRRPRRSASPASTRRLICRPSGGLPKSETAGFGVAAA